MIQRLRQRHRSTFAVLALALPVGFGAALVVRPEPIGAGTLPPELLPAGHLDAVAPPAHGVRIDAGASGVRVAVAHDFRVPKAQLYWSATSVAAGGALPTDAIWIASLRPGLVRSVASLPGADGVGLIYSLAHGEVAATVTIRSEGAGR